MFGARGTLSINLDHVICTATPSVGADRVWVDRAILVDFANAVQVDGRITFITDLVVTVGTSTIANTLADRWRRRRG